MNDRTYEHEYREVWELLSGAEKDTLIALCTAGPLWDGDVPSKSGRDELLDKNLAVKVVVKGKQGYQAATYRGFRVYQFGFAEQQLAA